MLERSSRPNPFLFLFGLRPSVMWPGSKTAPSPTPLIPKQPHTKSTLVGNCPLLHSDSLAVMLSLIYKDHTKLSLVNMQLTAYTSALLRKREHICSIAIVDVNRSWSRITDYTEISL